MKKRFVKILAVALASVALFAGCGINYNATLVTITNDGAMDKITLGYGNFVARYTQALYDSYYGSVLSDGFWTTDMYGNGNTMEEDTKDSILDEMKTYYLCKAHAADYGVELTEEQLSAIDEAAKKFMEDNDDRAIEELGAKEEYVRDYLTYRTYYVLVKEKVDAEAPETTETTDADTENSEAEDSSETESYFEQKVDEWEAGLTWTVDETQWKKVVYENKFVTKTSDEASEEATEE